MTQACDPPWVDCIGSTTKPFLSPEADLTPESFAAFLAESRPKRKIENSRRAVETERQKALGRIEKLLRNPARTDPVYKVLQRLFHFDSDFNLSRSKKDRFRIRRLALKRFLLGYPPRKQGDTSYGDAINWESIIDCAMRSKGEVIVVSRDSDYGATHNKESVLNDWLREEFKQRVSRKRTVGLFSRLTDAFKHANIAITKVDQEAEETAIEQRKLTSPKFDATTDVQRILDELRTRLPPAFAEPVMR